MKSLTVLVLVLTIYLRAIYSQNIETTIKFKLTKIDEHHYSFTKIGEQKEILIENHLFSIRIESEYGLSNLNCRANSTGIYDGVLEENKNKQYFYVNDIIALSQMDGIWRCDVTVYSETIVECTFPVHVRRKGIGAIYINNNRSDTELTDPFVKQYDEIGHYTFTDGEISEFTCKAKEPYTISMIFYDKKAKKEFLIPGYNRKSSLLLKLTSQYDGAHLDCQVRTHTNSELSTIRVQLSEQILSKKKGYRSFEVNGQFLLPTNTKAVQIDDIFEYEYFDRETVDITTKVDHHKYDSMNCEATGNIPDKLERFTKPNFTPLDTRYSVILKKENNGLRLKCTIYVKDRFTTKDRYYKSVDVIAIDFKYYDENSPTDFDPVIFGLSKSNILKKFKENTHTGRIYYEYRSNTVLELKCFSKDNKNSEWKFNDQDMLSEVKVGRLKNVAEERTFKMREKCNKSTIICRSKHSTTHLILIRAGFSFNILNDKEDDIVDNVPTETEPELKSQDNTKNTTIIIIIGVVVAVIIISVAVWMIITVYKRKRKAKQINSSFTYKTLPEHCKGTMPVPHQWQPQDDPPYCTPVDANLDAMYSKSIPKHCRLRNPPAIYAEVQYAESPYTEIPNVENPYSEVILDAGKDKFQYANVDLKPNGLENNTEIVAVSDKKDDKYENVFDGQRYGNVHSVKNFVESAYCEM